MPTDTLTMARIKARELERLLQRLAAKDGEGSCAEFALLAIDDVLGYLSDDADNDEPERPRLRLVGRQ